MATRNRPNGAPEPAKIVVPETPPHDESPSGLENGAGYDADVIDDLGDLAALDGEAYREVTWLIFRRRVPGEVVDKRSNPNAPMYVAKMVGELDVDAMSRQIGGGSFRVVGYKNGRKFIERPWDVDGPRKVFDNDPTPPASALAAIGAAPESSGSRLDALERMLERVIQRLDTPAQSAALGFRDVIEAAKLLQPAPVAQKSPDAVAVNGMIELLKQGIELGSTREPGSGTDWGLIIEKSLPVLEKVVAGALSRGVRRPPGRPVPPNVAGSHAEVIADVAPAPQPSEPDESPRMAAVIDALSRAIDDMGGENELEPAAFADTVETILLPSESAMLRMTTGADLMAQLAPFAERFPALAKPQARVYVDAVLAALRTPSSEA